ncbi:interferon-induced protein with tetratricopeptide repeats 5-like [Oreochromis aureus]|uniref:interferon-induced protein with tetratricopeptide repeats 5-like n=1 Tax=Oreochromis aureus TaxID=47969 RepID=UPI001954E92F|nr:interferon-induced protein with tetratricopeptide repeats 5-like [Oreochromis aureus]
MAWLKYHDGDFAQSQSYCQRVEDILVKYPTGSSGSLLPEVYGEQAWTYLKLSKSYYLKAVDSFRKALEIQTDDTEWNAGYAIALFRTEEWVLENLEENEEPPSIKQLHSALELNPDDAVLQSMLAVKLGAYKKYEEAEGLLKKALKTDPDNPHVSRYVGKYFRNHGLLIPLKKYEKKVCAKKLKQIAERRLAKHPGDGEALALVGQVARAEGNRKEAAEFYEKALNCDKDNEEYLSALCELRLELQ